MEKIEWTIPAEPLRDGIKFANAPGGKDPENFLRFKFGENQLSLTGFNQNYWTTAVVDLESQLIQEFLIDPRVLAPLASVATPTFKLEVKENKCRIKWINGEMRFGILPATDFLQVPNILDLKGIVVDVEELQEALDKTKAALMKTKTMLPYESTALICEGKDLTILGMDRNRMHCTVIPSATESLNATVLLPPRMTAALSSVKSKGRVVIRWNDYIIHAETIDRHEIVGAKVTGEIPKNWRKIFSLPSEFSVCVNRSELEASMLRFCSTHDNEAKVTFMMISKGVLGMVADSVNPPRSTRETVSCDLKGELSPVTLDAGQILDATRACKPCLRVTIDITKAESGRFTAILSPNGDEPQFKAALALYRG